MAEHWCDRCGNAVAEEDLVPHLPTIEATYCPTCRRELQDGEMTQVKCSACGEEFPRLTFNEDHFDWTMEGSELQPQAELCPGCVEHYRDLSEHTSTLVRWNGDKEKVRFNEHFAEAEDGDEAPGWFFALYESRRWVSTDAWRGYYQTKLKGLQVIADGWVTQQADAVKPQQRAEDLHALLEEEVGKLGFEFYWLYESTSNLFSNTCDMLVKAEDNDRVMKWLQDHGFTIEELQYALS